MQRNGTICYNQILHSIYEVNPGSAMFVVGPENPPSRLRLLFEISYRHHQIASNTVAHDGCPLTHRIEIGQVLLPRLFACISEERGLLYGASQAVQRDKAGRHALGAKK